MVDRVAATPEGIAAAAELLRGGGLVAFPTDTVYGIGCRGGDPDALEAIFVAKRRPPEKRVPLLVASLEQATGLGYHADERARRLVEAFWPGGLTVVLPSDGDGESQAFRAPDHPVALALIAAAGPLATSSANRSGEPETYEADDVAVAFADTDLLDLILDGGPVPGGTASSVVDLTQRPARLLRDGAIPRARLAEVVELAE
jgi:tRNA threonylcarbamoyl adenosine modification protein (Sua5/YciO/YrdC/YwlC family)